MNYREDIENLIEEWFTDCTSEQEVAKLYGFLFYRVESQMAQRFKELKQE